LGRAGNKLKSVNPKAHLTKTTPKLFIAMHNVLLKFTFEDPEEIDVELPERLVSSLSEPGMRICKQISSLTNIDCYYHLFNDPNPDIPDFENCPKCNGPKWKRSYLITLSINAATVI
jgi:hypothetical protein